MSNSAVYKYTLPNPGTPGAVVVPVGAQPLSFGRQGSSFVLWAKVDPEIAATETLNILIVGTGWSVTDLPSKFLGTSQVANDAFGDLVWHCFYDFLERV